MVTDSLKNFTSCCNHASSNDSVLIILCVQIIVFSFTDIFEHIRFLLFSFSLLHFLVVGFVW